ncbi:MAG: M99 family carboxypeptidase catalytic domain-containing protein [Desulfonauticus sp.]|nr:M99 family carboxypeptidase catalytic domain-containing protein [Desulfonauticus sp.]
MKPILWLIFLYNFILLPTAFASVGIFFKNTFFPLKIYYLKGENPGPTLMIQGGIQGDELSGIICAQLLTRAKVKKGNLIIVPRANWPALFLFKRQLNVDLNRRFDKHYAAFYEDTLAKAIFYLASLSQGLIHLHEGSGFYSAVYINQLRNPKRYGQAVIIDDKNYNNINLANLAKDVLKEINPIVLPQKYKFSLFNMMTFSPNTLYPEQKKSLTYNVLKNYSKPAFAIEVSKHIKQLDWKVKYMLKTVQKFCHKLGVDIFICWDKQTDSLVKNWFKQKISLKIIPKNKYVYQLKIVKESDHNNMSQVGLQFGDIDIDLNNNEVIFFPWEDKFIKIIIDGKVVKTYKLKRSVFNIRKSKYPILLYSVDGKIHYAFPQEHIQLYKGQTLIVYGLWPNTGEVINIKGYAPINALSNTGQDINEPIYLLKAAFLPKYIKNLKNKAWSFEIVRETKNLPPYKWIVEVKEPKLNTIIFSNKNDIFSINNTKLKSGHYQITIYPDSFFILLDKNPIPYYNQDIIYFSPGAHQISVRNNKTFDLIKTYNIAVTP